MDWYAAASADMSAPRAPQVRQCTRQVRQAHLKLASQLRLALVKRVDVRDVERVHSKRAGDVGQIERLLEDVHGQSQQLEHRLPYPVPHHETHDNQKDDDIVDVGARRRTESSWQRSSSTRKVRQHSPVMATTTRPRSVRKYQKLPLTRSWSNISALYGSMMNENSESTGLVFLCTHEWKR